MGNWAITNEAIQLDGYSGYDVLLYKNKQNNFVVRKQSKNKKQNGRLKKQFEKHLFFEKLGSDLYHIPKVLKYGEEECLFFYEYRFVEGITFIHFIEKSFVEDINYISDKILNILKDFSCQTNYYETKCEGSIYEGVGKKINENIETCQLRGTAIEKILLSKLEKLDRHENKTLCHGDFTFDNIIIDEDMNIWLIDFLDLFYPHYWFDISKLFQDIDGKWYEIKHGIILPGNKITYLKGRLVDGINKFDDKYQLNHDFSMAVVFLRIFPYANSDKDRKILENKIKYFLKI